MRVQRAGPTDPVILIVSNARDLTTDFVVLEAQRRGARYVRLNIEDLPQTRLRLGFERETDWSLQLSDRRLEGDEISAAYFRRPGTPEVDQAVSDPAERAYCGGEWAAVLKSLYHRIGPRWLSAPANIAAAEDKPRQLLAARRLGFSVPDTAVTNDIDVFNAFLSGPASVAKPLRHARLEGATERVIFTRRVDAATARDAHAIAAAPMVLQREVIKRNDVRVTVVGDQVFAVTIDSQVFPETEVDWRRGNTLQLAHTRHTLPAEISAACVSLVRTLDLGFGAIDLVLDRDGRYWFLEINPNGQWAWIESRTGYPIAAAIIEALLAKAAG